MSAKKLLIIWLIALMICGFFCTVYSSMYMNQHGTPPLELFRPFHWAVTIATTFFFYPLLFVIHHKAKKESTRGILIFSRL